MAKKLINSLQINGDKHIIGIPTVEGSMSKIKSPDGGGVEDTLLLTVNEFDDIVLEDGAMFTFLPTNQIMLLTSLTKLTISNGPESNLVDFEPLHLSDNTINNGNITFIYRNSRVNNRTGFYILNDHGHLDYADSNHSHEYVIPEVKYTPSGTITATFSGTTGTITIPETTSATTKVASSVGLIPGSFTANTPTQVTTVTGTGVSHITSETASVLTTASLSKTSTTSTVLDRVKLVSASVSTTSVLQGTRPVATVTKKCLTLSLDNTSTSVPVTGLTYTVTSTTTNITTDTYELDTSRGTAITGLVITSDDVVKTVTVTAGKAASYTAPTLTSTYTQVASDVHTHSVNYTPSGTITAKFSGREATLISEGTGVTSPAK